MDGYAIRFADLPGPWTIAGEVAAGAVPARALGRGEAIRIFTGAMLPAGADTVVVQEDVAAAGTALTLRSEEHTSELQSLMRISYAVFCLKKKTKQNKKNTQYYTNTYTHTQQAQLTHT